VLESRIAAAKKRNEAKQTYLARIRAFSKQNNTGAHAKATLSIHTILYRFQ
jgi:hypothetical protein